MTTFAVWSDTVWLDLGWPITGVPTGAPYFGQMIVYGDVPEAMVPGHLTDISDFTVVFGQVEVGNQLLTGSAKVLLHDGSAVWDDGTGSFDTLGGYYIENDPVTAYGTLLIESEVRSDGSFGASRYLNADEHFGTRTADRLAGSEKIDILKGGRGDDTLIGRDGADRLFGGAGDDVLRGGEGSDTLSGGAGDDILRGGDGNDYLRGGAGRDVLFAEQGIDHLQGNAGRDTLINRGTAQAIMEGGRHGDKIVSHGQSDIHGGAGRDRIVLAGIGGDEIHGGTGVDTFVFRPIAWSVPTYVFHDFDAATETLDFTATGLTADSVEFSSQFEQNGIVRVVVDERLYHLTFTNDTEVTLDNFLF
ncbi:calcium-binding protein [Arenibacterium halophilum]|uniref:Calcium-binding protein n=1 Tax=Arenibacterium halophilum TaxID=2583821 RepID=A0ABY2X914_9RHOB|nr:calcium-binding protein [Arenibacterium halophilum]TMV11897.1 calcium-binding protein [Arenibacterium halophilum]